MEKKQNESDFSVELRKEAEQYLPGDQKSLEFQRRLLQQLAEVVPPISVCVSKAERDYWPQVEKEKMPLEKVASLCAADVNHIIRITVVENLNLEGQTEENLLKAWAALDYYCEKLEQKQAAPLQALLNRLTGILREKKEMHQKVEELAAMISAMERLEEEQPDAAQSQNDLEKTVAADHSGEAVQKIPPTGSGKDLQKTGKKKSRALLLLVPAAAVILLLVLMPVFRNLSKVSTVEKAIAGIGQVSLSSGEAIAAAEQSYSQLSESQQGKVENYSQLADARTVYDCLVTENAIETIGKVSMESQEAIENAEQLYAALSQEQKQEISNYKTLTAARKEYDRLTAAVEKAVKAINAIGTVNLNSGAKISAARKAYDALSKDNLQSYVTEEAKTLTLAETAYTQCVSQDLYDKAMEAFNAGKYEEALAQFVSIFQSYSNSTAAKNARDPAQKCRMTLAENAFSKGDQYTAMKLLKEMDSTYAQTEEVRTLREKIQNKLENARPKNGNKFSDKAGWGWCKLNVTAGRDDVCVKVIPTDNPANYLMFYVRAGESSEVNIKDGEYTIVFTTGEYWYSKDIGFGDDAVYQTINGQLSLTSWRSGSYVYYYRYELNLSMSSQSDFTTRVCSAADFWK